MLPGSSNPVYIVPVCIWCFYIHTCLAFFTCFAYAIIRVYLLICFKINLFVVIEQNKSFDLVLFIHCRRHGGKNNPTSSQVFACGLDSLLQIHHLFLHLLSFTSTTIIWCFFSFSSLYSSSGTACSRFIYVRFTICRLSLLSIFHFIVISGDINLNSRHVVVMKCYFNN